MKRWSKLQRELYKIIDKNSNFQLHCIAYPMNSQWGSTSVPRYYITIGNEIIWDYPSDFIKIEGMVDKYFPYSTDISDISQLIREYIDSSKVGLLSKTFPNDKWSLTTILKVFDRRIGKRQLLEWLETEKNDMKIIKLIENRLKKSTEDYKTK